jgi:hypothetical protein
LAGFRQALLAVAKAAEGRKNLVALIANPISEGERSDILEKIQQHNPGIDLYFWRLILGGDTK